MRGAPSKRNIPQSTITLLATIGCIGLTLFLIAATIVVGLIPLYLSGNDVSLNPYALRSKDIIMSIEVEENETFVDQRRRKRQAGDLYDYINGNIDDTGKDLIKTKLLAMLPSKTVQDLSISNISIGYQAPSRRRRFALSKRGVNYPKHSIVLVIQFYIIYRSACIYPCQINTGSTLRSTLYDMSLTTFIFTNVPILKNGVFYKYAPRIKFIRVVYVSIILPGLSSSTPSIPAITVTLTTTSTSTTTSATTTTSTANLVG